MRFIHCSECASSGTMERFQIAAFPTGVLVIACPEHGIVKAFDPGSMIQELIEIGGGNEKHH